MNEFVPSDILAMWAGGVTAGAALVALWRVVGPGFLWLAGGVTLLTGVPALLVDPSPFVIVAVVAALAGVFLARRPERATPAFALAAAGFVVTAFADGVVQSVTATLLLGSVTTGMLLGHWYLVDPRLPRWSLFRLGAVAGVGLALEVGQLVARGALGWEGGDAILGWAFVAIAVVTGVLITAVWFSLREPSYAGVMAATGLSYLAVMTSAGTVVLGRTLLT